MQQQQITRGDYLEDLITIYIENNTQKELGELYSQFIFQCNDNIQKVLTPSQVIKISLNEQESQLLKFSNTCYLAGITVDGHKETFNGSLTFKTRGEVVFYEPETPASITASATEASNCPCQGLTAVYSNCCQPAIKAYFSLNYVPTKLSELTNDTDFQDSVQVAQAISTHNQDTTAHPYIQSAIASETEALEVLINNETALREQADNTLQDNIDTETSLRVTATEALQGSINAETTAREQAISLAISTTEAYADNSVSVHNSSTEAHPYIQGLISAEVTNRENADNNLQTQIDGLAAASDVTDIVGTYAELQAYDTQHLNDNDIIKVLSDSTHEDEPSYYRFDKNTDTFSYIGSESASYTKAQADTKFVTQTTTINGEALSQNITLTATEVGALPSDTTINDLTTTAQQNALNSGVTSAVVSQVGTNTTNIASNTSTIASHTTTLAQHTTAITTNTSAIAANTEAISGLQDLSNLSDLGNDKLRSLNSYANYGELLRDADGLSFVQKYAHSTFDLSKFTVVGSPNITDDGIASGFSSSNYIITISIDLSTANSWEIQVRFKTPTSRPSSGNPCVLGIDGTKVRLYININGLCIFYLDEYSSDLTFSYENNTVYDVKCGYKDGKAYFEYKKDSDSNYTETTPVEKTATNANGIAYIGKRADGAEPYLSGSVDLKQLSITVDGVEVFSGNKTGIDTIKPDDYTVVGTPTISADGIASGFSSNSYITKDLGSLTTSDFELISPKFTISNYEKEYNGILGLAPTSNGTQIYLFLNNYSQDIETASYTFVCKQNGVEIFRLFSRISNLIDYTTKPSVQFKVTYKDSTWSWYLRANDDLNFTFLGTYQDSNPVIINSLLTLGLETPQCMEGSIDLNSLKIYVDGNLVYQPCLKIPYTESKTGSKIVDSIYRDRVNDMAEQFGYANYYTLSDIDFTLPQVELYGLIGAKTLRDSYENGINKWYLYSNRDLEQQGSCTSGVEVTLAKPFADTNYVLSVPYSAKSATAFTPTQTGDWFAKGKGVL